MKASIEYQNRQNEINFQLKAIKLLLSSHKKGVKSWGCVSELGYVKENLSEIESFLKSSQL